MIQSSGNTALPMQYALYIASAFGALALFMMMPRQGYNPRKIGALIGAMTLGALWLCLAEYLPDTLGIERAAFAYYYIFSFLAIACATRVITHTQPVHAALWFVMMVIASVGIFLILDAEFIAFATLIIYGGAILVTYLFVIMLASETSDAQAPQHTPIYDRIAYEPVAAVAAGFFLLAVLLTAIFTPLPSNPDAHSPSDSQIIASTLTNRAARRLAQQAEFDEIANLPTALADNRSLDNTEHVGLDLFRSHPLGLELTGVILLVSLVGAVVIAKLRVEPDTAEPAPA